MTQISTYDRNTIYPHTFVEILFPSGTLALFDGVGEEFVSGQTFVSSNTWGALLGADAAGKAVGLVPTGFELKFLASESLLAAARDPYSSGSQVRVWTANIDPALGPSEIVLEHIGFVNTMTIEHGFPAVVSVECSSAADYLSDPDASLSMTQAGQKLIDPTDKFCEFLPNIEQALPWGGRSSPRHVLAVSQPSVSVRTPFDDGFF